MRHRPRGTALPTFALVICGALLLPACQALAPAPIGAHASRPVRRDLIGAWQLVSIELDTPAGAVPDPFYGEHCTGLLVYDASGWMSVQISAPNRTSVPVPDSRPPASEPLAAAQLKARALDTYYAYVGTWTLNESAALITHQVTSALYPDEGGARYTQAVAVQGGRMTLSSHRVLPAGAVTQTKTWQRL